MKLPNADQAVVEIRKLRDYCLNPNHHRGRHKARLFKSALGFTADDAVELQRLLLNAARHQEAVFLGADDYGQRYTIDLATTTTHGTATVRSLWIIRMGEHFPRLASCYVL